MTPTEHSPPQVELTPAAHLYIDDLAARYPHLSTVVAPVAQAVLMLCECYYSGGKIMVCGNGGSASDSEHIVGELMKSFVLRRSVPPEDVERLEKSGCNGAAEIVAALQRGIPSIALTSNTALLTAISNDTHADMLFAQQVYVYTRPGDVLLGLSTSGNSRNVVNALKVARAFGVGTIGLTSSRACLMDELCDISIKVPEAETFKAQEYHLPIYHALCLALEEQVFGPE